MTNTTILVVDDQAAHTDLICSVLNSAGYTVHSADSGPQALARLDSGAYGLVLTDQQMPTLSGLELLREVHARHAHLPVIIVTAYGTVETAVDAMKAGAADFIQKPFTPDELLLVVRRVLDRQELVEELRSLRQRVGEPYRFDRIISQSPRMNDIFEMIRNLADLDTTVLITGETGTGKELVAHALHHNSQRRDQRFVRINCGALTESLLESELFGHERGAFSGAVQSRRGKFEYSAGGTILLDEIGEVSPSMQVKLLRVLQEKEIQRVGGNETIPVDVRILATTNRDLEQAVAAGTFRSDLFYRLNVVRIQIPPLRARMEDVPLLAAHFLAQFCAKSARGVTGFNTGAMDALLNYDWPGNVRELANVIERAAVMTTGAEVTQLELPGRAAGGKLAAASCFDLSLPFKEGRQLVLSNYERAYIVECLRRHKDNIAQSAQHCGVDAKTFYRKMQEYDLDKRDYKKADTGDE